MSQPTEVSDEDIFDMETQRLSPVVPSSQGSSSPVDNIFLQPTQPLLLNNETSNSDSAECETQPDNGIYTAATQPLFLHTLEDHSDIDSDAETQPYIINETASTEPLERTALDDSASAEELVRSRSNQLRPNGEKSTDQSAENASAASTSNDRSRQQRTFDIHEAETQPLLCVPPSDDEDDREVDSENTDGSLAEQTVHPDESDVEENPMSPSLFHDDSDVEDLPPPRSSSPIQPTGPTELKVTRKSDLLFPRPSLTWSQAETLPLDECVREEHQSSDSEFEITIASQSIHGSPKFEGFTSSAATKSSDAMRKIQDAVAEESDDDRDYRVVGDTSELRSKTDEAGPSTSTRTRTRGSRQAANKQSRAASTSGETAAGQIGKKPQKVENGDPPEGTSRETESRILQRRGRPPRGAKSVQERPTEDLPIGNETAYDLAGSRRGGRRTQEARVEVAVVSTRSTRSGKSTLATGKAKNEPRTAKASPLEETAAGTSSDNAAQAAEISQEPAVRPKRGKRVSSKPSADSSTRRESSSASKADADSDGNRQPAGGPTAKPEVARKGRKRASDPKPATASNLEASSTSGTAEDESETPAKVPKASGKAKKSSGKAQEEPWRSGTDPGIPVISANLREEPSRDSAGRDALPNEPGSTNQVGEAPVQRCRTRGKAAADSSTEVETQTGPALGKRNRNSRSAPVAGELNKRVPLASTAAAAAEQAAPISLSPATRAMRGGRRSTRAARLQPADENQPSKETRRQTGKKKSEAAADAANGPSPVKREKTSRQRVSGQSDRDSIEPSMQRRKRRTLAGKVRVCFTGLDNERQRQLVSVLVELIPGGEVVEESSKSSVLVTDKVRRTVKFLCAVGRGIPIVHPDWLELSSASRKFLDPWQHLLKDPTGERKFSFKLKTTLEQAAASSLLAGWCICATGAVLPPPSELKEIVMAAGGQFGNADTDTSENTVVVSCNEDKDQWRKWQRRGVPIIQAEAILSGILQHQFAPEKFKQF